MCVDPNLINNKSEFELIKKQSICDLCNYILWEPKQCSVCESAFCEECLDEYFTKNGISCPNKCENPTFKTSKLLKNILSLIKFNCQNNCGVLIPYEEYFIHSRSKCNKIDYKKKYLELKEQLEELKKEYNLWVPKPSESIKKTTFLSKNHVHPLIYLETIDRGGWLCNICRESHKAREKSYYCTLCDYDLCKNCQSLEKNNKE